ncbi:MFS transporter [Trinickia caryophylli]|uniref:Predicted arabinose efflux permease, MFS family n=1 Tax=Trinickia caryophylli TaxID=28094 RepID=A0A1X7GQ33_TRICW|nr:MFS transporter [Trinickia caryophylli]PMS10583.1 MFS transporter [Trinickia caryophylli]TRX19080.1 MFS transporter [Trinickia caryophylli]WQE10119.1 MFS transporter [Trinickia caryophylli]SMF73053.1 Predicted arabinose efflux permease, MFS family [Trinickia caryophylli]GLU35140.1 MFS transporter [Trinickia caryophylli]
MTTVTAERKLFHGWVVVAAAFAVTFIGFGCAYTFSSFVQPLQAEFGASRGSVALVFSIAGFLYFALGAASGPLADRWGTKRLAVAGMLLVGAGFALASHANTIAAVYAFYGLGIGLGVGTAFVPTVGVVQRWFVRRRAFASGLAVSGIGVGTLVMPPLATWLIARFGWRETYLLLGIVAAAIGTGMALLLEDDPRRRGLLPDGDAPDSDQASAPPTSGVPLARAWRSPRFIGLYAACLASSLGVFVPFVHLVPFAIDHHVSAARAVLLFGAIGAGSTAGRVLLGNVADRIGRDTFLVVVYAGMAVTLAIWAAAASWWMLMLFALSFGLFYGGWVAVLPAIVADHFGGRHVGAIIGALSTSVAIGTLVGPSAAGFAFDKTHSYVLPVALSALGNAAAGAIAFATNRLGRAPNRAFWQPN